MTGVKRLGYLLELGLMDYGRAWDLQRRLAAVRARDEIPDTLILLQHPHTYTLGRSGRIEHLLMDEVVRAEKGVTVYHVDRGGDITYHGPGQLVGYPILCLGRPGADGRLPPVDYVGYLRQIEEVLIQTLSEWGITARRSEGYTGVWVDSGEAVKVAAVGVKVSGTGVSQHGFALNVEPDLGFFAGIVPCGIRDRGVSSMAQLLGRRVDLRAVADVVAERFGQVFGMAWQRASVQEVGELAGIEMER